MAKKKITKTDAIIEYVTANPDASAQEAADGVNAKHGFDISSGYVSTIKSQKGLVKKKRGKTARKTAQKSTATKTRRRAVGRPKRIDVTIEQLRETRLFADQVGGIEAARTALDALAELQA